MQSKRILELIKTTLVGGILFLVPLILLVILLRQLLQYTDKLLHPIAQLLPAKTIIGVAIPDLLAAVVLIVVAFLAGLLAKTRFGARLGANVEELILKRLPGFKLLKSMTQGITSSTSGSEVTVALANIDETWQLSFVVERHPNGLLTVFVPSAPTPATGSIFFLKETQVRHLDVSVSAAVKCIMQLGAGSGELLKGVTQIENGLSSDSGNQLKK